MVPLLRDTDPGAVITDVAGMGTDVDGDARAYGALYCTTRLPTRPVWAPDCFSRCTDGKLTGRAVILSRIHGQSRDDDAGGAAIGRGRGLRPGDEPASDPRTVPDRSSRHSPSRLADTGARLLASCGRCAGRGAAPSGPAVRPPFPRRPAGKGALGSPVPPPSYSHGCCARLCACVLSSLCVVVRTYSVRTSSMARTSLPLSLGAPVPVARNCAVLDLPGYPQPRFACAPDPD